MIRPTTRREAATIVALVVAAVLALAIATVVLGPILFGGDEPGLGEAVSEPAPTLGVEDIDEGGTGRNFEVVAHEPLLDEHQYGGESFDIPRGSNGDITAAGDCVYVGSVVGHQPPLIVDVSTPESPEVVGPVPDAVPGTGNGIEGVEASGGLLVIDQRRPPSQLWFEPPDGLPDRGLSVWDISEDCREPELVGRHDYGNLSVHDLRLWRDPQNPDRVLAVHSFLDNPDVVVLDLTDCRGASSCDPPVVAEWSLENQTGFTTNTHEAIVSTDGRRIYAAQPDAGYLLLDSSNLLASLRGEGDCDPSAPTGVPAEDHCLTVLDPDVGESLNAQPDHPHGIPHSLLRIPDRPYFLASGESSGPHYVEGNGTVQLGSCPGSGIRFYGIKGGNGNASAGNGTPTAANTTDMRSIDPETVGRYRLPGQRQANCQGERFREGTVASPGWLSPHFSLAFPNVTFTTYYSGGLRAIDVSDPAAPREAGYFFNDPVSEVRWASYGMSGEAVTNEDGTAVRQPHPTDPHVFAFSDPIVVDGYVVYADVHSGLYVLEYTGPHADQLPEAGTCLPANPGGVEPGYEPCPPYGQTDWGTSGAPNSTGQGG